MLISFQAFNNITVSRLLIVCYGVPLDYYYYQTTNKFEKLLEQENAENILKMATLIFPTIVIYIEPTKLLEVGPPNTKYDSKKRFCEKYTGTDWGDDGEIEEIIIANNNKDDNKKILKKKIDN